MRDFFQSLRLVRLWGFFLIRFHASVDKKCFFTSSQLRFPPPLVLICWWRRLAYLSFFHTVVGSPPWGYRLASRGNPPGLTTAYTSTLPTHLNMICRPDRVACVQQAFRELAASDHKGFQSRGGTLSATDAGVPGGLAPLGPEGKGQTQFCMRRVGGQRDEPAHAVALSQVLVGNRFKGEREVVALYEKEANLRNSGGSAEIRQRADPRIPLNRRSVPSDLPDNCV